MFEHLVGYTADESTLFYKVSDEIIKNFSGLVKGSRYLLLLEEAGDKKAMVREILVFADYELYADYFFSHTYVPYCVRFERGDIATHIVMPGIYKFMSQQIVGDEFIQAYIRDRHPEAPKFSEMMPRELAEKGFAAITGQLSRAKRPRAV